MKRQRIHRYGGYKGYRGSYWAIVLGPKNNDLKPKPLYQFIRTANKIQFLERAKAEHKGAMIRAIRQPMPPFFEAGM